ncbi:unnamed protein product [Polarella glacialis]|uniref:Bestrophin homolog n=1 Tax=Polarella glacialis TaxID=89957 RepID=A0A813D023_POLGL|nr:unnamed protein product [Polarella glacialis]
MAPCGRLCRLQLALPPAQQAEQVRSRIAGNEGQRRRRRPLRVARPSSGLGLLPVSLVALSQLSSSSLPARRQPKPPSSRRSAQLRRPAKDAASTTRRAEGRTAGLLDVAERYSSDDWLRHMLDLPFSNILRRISSHLSFNIMLATVVWAYHRETHMPADALPLTPLTVCSAALGLLLVFRTTAAYERWQLGQRNAYHVRHHLQSVLRTSKPWMSSRQMAMLQAQLRSFPRILAQHLTAQAGAGYIYGVGPRDLLTQLSETVANSCAQPDVSLGALGAYDRIQGHISETLFLVTDMERLAAEAIPRDYSRHTSRFLTAWIWYLPFVLLDFGDLMPVVVGVISWALLSIEEIGHALEDPFNSSTQPVQVQLILETGGGEHTLAPSGVVATQSYSEGDNLWERSTQATEDNVEDIAWGVSRTAATATATAPQAQATVLLAAIAADESDVADSEEKDLSGV